MNELRRGRVYHFFMDGYFDFDGREVSLEEWYVLWVESGNIAETTLDRTQGKSGFAIQVSTIWTGRSWGLEDPPLIYETMAFSLESPNRWDDIGSWRWATSGDAAEGHDRIVRDLIFGDLILYESDDW